jgi:hypothetical protein
MKTSIAAGCLAIGAAVWLAGPGFTANVPQPPASGLPPLDYSLGPDSQPQAGVPQGTVTRQTLAPGKFFPGTPHNYQVYVPAQYDRSRPIAYMIFLDANGDRDNTDRPVKGVNDLTMPIKSPLDKNGMAIRNGIPGEHKSLLDLRLQYVLTLQRQQTAGFFWEVYNVLNTVNFGNVNGNRNASSFNTSTVADTARSMQIGVRYTF